MQRPKVPATQFFTNELEDSREQEEENLSNYEPRSSVGPVPDYEEEDDYDRRLAGQYNYTNVTPRRRTTVEKADRVQMGNVYHGPVTFVTYLPESSSKSPAIKAPAGPGEAEKKAETLPSDEEVKKRIDDFTKRYEVSIPPQMQQEIETLQSDIKRLREQNAEREKLIERNGALIEKALAKRETQRPVQQKPTPNETQDKRLDDLRTFICLVGEEESFENKHVLHMIDARDIEGLREILNEDVRRWFSLNGDEDGGLGYMMKGVGDPETLSKRLAELRSHIEANRGGNEQLAKTALNFLDNNDIAGLKMILTTETKQKFGLLDDETKSDDESESLSETERTEKKKKKRVLKDVERLVRAIRSGSLAEVQEVARRVSGKDPARALLSSGIGTGGGLDVPSIPDNKNDFAGDELTAKEVQVQQGRGHIKTISTQNSAEPVTGVVFMPKYKWICVTHFKSARVWMYNEEGITLGSFILPKMKNPSGLVTLKSKANTIAISDFNSKRVHLVTLYLEDNHLEKKDHNIWKLLFQPADIANFQMNMLLVASMHDDSVSIFTEEGKHVGNIKIHGQGIGKLYSAVGCGNEVLVVDCNDEESQILYVNLSGTVTRTYDGKKADQQSLEDPLHVLQDDKGRIIIADHDKNRVHLVNKDGKFQQFLLQKGDGMYLPRRFYFDKSDPKRPRLFLGCGSPGDVQVRIYDYRALCSNLFDDLDDGEDAA